MSDLMTEEGIQAVKHYREIAEKGIRAVILDWEANPDLDADDMIGMIADADSDPEVAAYLRAADPILVHRIMAATMVMLIEERRKNA